MKNKKLFSGFALIFIFVILLSSSVFAEIVDRSKSSLPYYFSVAPLIEDNSARVYDFAELLSEKEEAQLEEKIAELQNRADIDVVIVTTNENDSSAMAYADDFSDYNHFADDNIIFLMDMDNREQWISTKGSCINTFSDGDIDGILDDTTPEMTNGKYYAAASAFLDGVHSEYLTKGERMVKVLRPSYTSVFISIISVVLALVISLKKHSTVKKGTTAAQYSENGKFNLVSVNTQFVNTNTVSRVIESSSSSSSSGGGSSSHSSSSGSSHGGGGRSF